MAKSESVVIHEIQRGEIECFIVGQTPLILNSMNAKVWRELLLPKGRKTRAERQQTLKHDPYEEYVRSVYRERDPRSPTELVFPTTGLKKAITGAALETPGAIKAQIGRLTYVVGEWVAIYGVPEIYMTHVRSADMNRTPDIRTRAILPEWACRIRINYVRPTLTQQMVVTLLANAGMVMGIGDNRQEKGAGNYGHFRVAGADDATLQRIMKNGGREAQIKALDNPTPYDARTAEILTWFSQEIANRGRQNEVTA